MIPPRCELPAGLVPLTPELLRPAAAPEAGGEPEASHQTALRTSSYTVYVDLPEDPEHVLLVHGYTGACLRVSQRVATYLRSLDARRRAQPHHEASQPAAAMPGTHERPAETTLALLQRQRFLVAMSAAQEEAYVVRLVHGIHAQSLRAPPSYTVLLTYQCNLRCVYCFQEEVRAEPQDPHQRQSMDPATVDRLVQGMLALEAAHGLRDRSGSKRKVRFFGGEPLLAANRGAVERFVERMAPLGGATFSATTNGTELHHYRGLLGPGGISHLDVTLDGPAQVHDRRRLRIHGQGQGSFAQIADNITLALDEGATVQVRVNVDRFNVDALPALCDTLEARGWVDRQGFLPLLLCAVHASIPSVDPSSVFDGWQLREAARILRQSHRPRVAVKTQDTDLQGRIRRVLDREARPSSLMVPAFCVAHTTEYLFDPAANIYVCAERTCDPGLRVGHVTQAGEVLVDLQNLRKWRNRTVTTNAVCRRCRYALFCGGGCAAQAEVRRGGFYKGYCDGFDKRFRAAAAEAYLAHAAHARAAAQATAPCTTQPGALG